MGECEKLVSGKRDIEAKKLVCETLEMRREKTERSMAYWLRRHATDAI